MTAPLSNSNPRAVFPAPCPFGPGDIVRCVNLAGSGAPLPLTVGNIYTVAAVKEAESLDAALGQEAPLVYLRGYERSFLAVRFELVIKAPANDQPCEAVAIPARMARVFRECFEAHGACDVHDLARAGFTAAQITEYADEARRIAGPVDPDCGEVA
ncbi:hypothetical protein [Xanthobacter flavus]|uniref:hypothetical protein n=1 Tax=Xanthobacter flavus TaxID=281 RepID=UPI001AE9DFC5|nr:hypothetical protein [Xanthobacter flavus]MBP2147960.1 hypothetical protein [Xanthobacter flavus]